MNLASTGSSATEAIHSLESMNLANTGSSTTEAI